MFSNENKWTAIVGGRWSVGRLLTLQCRSARFCRGAINVIQILNIACVSLICLYLADVGISRMNLRSGLLRLILTMILQTFAHLLQNSNKKKSSNWIIIEHTPTFNQTPLLITSTFQVWAQQLVAGVSFCFSFCDLVSNLLNWCRSLGMLLSVPLKVGLLYLASN